MIALPTPIKNLRNDMTLGVFGHEMCLFVYVCVFMLLHNLSKNTSILFVFRTKVDVLLEKSLIDYKQDRTKWHIFYYVYIQLFSIFVVLINCRLPFCFLIALYELLNFMCLHCILLILVLTHLATLS